MASSGSTMRMGDPRASWESATPGGGPSPAMVVERRIDYRDGVAYTYEDFVAEYRNQAPAEWAAATLAPPGYRHPHAPYNPHLHPTQQQHQQPPQQQHQHPAPYFAAPGVGGPYPYAAPGYAPQQPWGGAVPGQPYPNYTHHQAPHPQHAPPMSQQPQQQPQPQPQHPAPFVDAGGGATTAMATTAKTLSTCSSSVGDSSPSNASKDSSSAASSEDGERRNHPAEGSAKQKIAAPVAAAHGGPSPFQLRDPNCLQPPRGVATVFKKASASSALKGYTRCLVKREREGMSGRLYPTFNLYIQEFPDEEAAPSRGPSKEPKLRLAMQAQKLGRSKTTHYRFFDMEPGKRVSGGRKSSKRMSKKASNYLGKMRGNFNRDEYEVISAEDNPEGGMGLKAVLASLVYDKCDLLSQVQNGASPRKMGLLLPVKTNSSGGGDQEAGRDGSGVGGGGEPPSRAGPTPEERLASMVSGLGPGEDGVKENDPSTPRIGAASLDDATRRWRLEDLNNYDRWAVRSRKNLQSECVSRVKAGAEVVGKTIGDGWLELTPEEARRLGCPFDRGYIRLRIKGEGWLPIGDDGEVDQTLATALRTSHSESPAGVHTNLARREDYAGEKKQYHSLQSKDPVFEKGNYRLNFHGRVKLPSVKNYQLVPPDAIDDIWTQFGKVSDDEFHLDFKAPITPMVAFAVAVSQFDY